MLFRSGAELCAKSEAFETIGVRLAPEPIRFQRACGTAACAARAAESGNLVSAEELMPVYLRPPQAQRSLRVKH